MDEPTPEAIRRGDEFSVASTTRDEEPQPVTRAEVAPVTLGALELVAHGFDLTTGRAKIEITYDAGLFEVAWITRRLTLKSLSEFEPVFKEAAAHDFRAPSQDKASS
jgi:hypothetical protein